MISSVTNKGQLRWQVFAGALDAQALTGFMRRLVQGADRKVLLIMEGLLVRDGGALEQWLVLHEEVIQVFRFPAPGL